MDSEPSSWTPIGDAAVSLSNDDENSDSDDFAFELCGEHGEHVQSNVPAMPPIERLFPPSSSVFQAVQDIIKCGQLQGKDLEDFLNSKYNDLQRVWIATYHGRNPRHFSCMVKNTLKTWKQMTSGQKERLEDDVENLKGETTKVLQEGSAMTAAKTNMLRITADILSRVDSLLSPEHLMTMFGDCDEESEEEPSDKQKHTVVHVKNFLLAKDQLQSMIPTSITSADAE
jgi:hypothetical protein